MRDDEIERMMREADPARTPLGSPLNARAVSDLGRIRSGVRRARRLRQPVRRRVRIAGFSALAAFAVVTGLVLTNVLGFVGWRGGADAAAADVLHEAAVAAIATDDPVVGPGQYLVVHTDAVNTPFGETAEGLISEFQVRSTDTRYIPYDREDEWVWIRNQSSVERTFGPESAAVAEGFGNGMDEDKAPERLRAAGGKFYDRPPVVSSEFLAALPRDPERLLNYIYLITLGTGPSPDGEALVFISDTLRSGIVSADLRAAFYEAAALIPGVTVTERQATLDGRVGVAIGRFESKWNARQDIIIDPETGLLIGLREVSFATDRAAPPGTVVTWTAITTTVADSAPPGGTPNGD